MATVVQLSPRAVREADLIYVYIAKRAPEGALRWQESLWAAIGLLRDQPAKRPLAPEGIKFDQEIRQILFKTRKGHTYRALFVVSDDETIVTVLSVRGPSQRLLRRKEIREALDE